ncbi:MAG: UvrD-helicase domain-containing protein [Acidobacteria bacterium]|nr:UvrD-helicase domain-containing protein [Acidobacteriota bacterium]
MNLTPDQKRAATAVGSVAVTAGAGTGKTSMLAARYLHHVQTDGMSPLSVVAVTFTDKAADELRSRIRKTLNAELGDEKVIAEVEAAQISTMHALASRICRDFYDLAEIPPDFSILDDTAKPLWMAEKFEEAVSLIDPEIFRTLGFSWLTSAISVLLKDPYSSDQALSLGSDQWKETIEKTSAETVTKIITSGEWSAANAAVSECRGKDGDKLEAVRADVISAMANPKDIEALNDSLKNFARNKGAAGNWPDGGLERLRQSLGALKDHLKSCYDLATLEYGPEDDEAARRIEPLAAAFRQVRDYISAEKLRDKVLDFGDLEHYSLKILDHPEAVEHYSMRWNAFLVDEFQDTNPIQTEILSRLTANAKLTIVGDEKQAIYGFRGADIGVFSRVREEIVTARSGIEVPLSLTFRTHHELVLTMNTIFEPVLDDLHQALDADRTDRPFAAPHVHSSVVEAAKGVGKAKHRSSRPGTSPGK